MERLGMLVLGFSTAVTVAVFVYALVPWPSYDVVIAMLAFAYVFFGGIIRLPVAHRGVPLFLGGRLGSVVVKERRRDDGTIETPEVKVARFLVGEGTSWLPTWPIMGAGRVDTRELSSDVKQFTVFTENDIQGSIDEATIQWRVTNPYQFLSVGPGVVDLGMRDLIRQVLRVEVRKVSDKAFLGIHEDVRNAIERRADEKARDWGVDITNVLLGVFSISPELMKAYQQQRLEVAQREGERVGLDFMREQIKLFVHPDIGLTSSQALEAIQLAVKGITKQVLVHGLSADPQLVAAIGQAAVAIRGR